MRPFQRILMRRGAVQGIVTAALVLGGADLATRFAVNQGTIHAKVAEASRRSAPTLGLGTVASRISLSAVADGRALD